MPAYLDLTGGLISSERVMPALGAQIGRQRAHGLVYAAARAADAEHITFSEALLRDSRSTQHLDSSQFAELLDPADAIGLCVQLANDSAERARHLAAGLTASHT